MEKFEFALRLATMSRVSEVGERTRSIEWATPPHPTMLVLVRTAQDAVVVTSEPRGNWTADFISVRVLRVHELYLTCHNLHTEEYRLIRIDETLVSKALGRSSWWEK